MKESLRYDIFHVSVNIICMEFTMKKWFFFALGNITTAIDSLLLVDDSDKIFVTYTFNVPSIYLICDLCRVCVCFPSQKWHLNKKQSRKDKSMLKTKFVSFFFIFFFMYVANIVLVYSMTLKMTFFLCSS